MRKLSRIKSQLSLVGSINEIIRTTQSESKRLEIERRQMTPPLNVLTRTPKNMARFVARVGFLADFQDWAADVITWQSTTQTVTVLAGWIFFCLNPRLLLFLPHLIVTSLSVHYYYARSAYSSEPTVLQKSRKTPRWSRKKKNVSFYVRNAQWIQNFMAMHSDTYDSVLELKPYVDWRDERVSARVLQYCWLSVPLMLVFFYVVPINWVVMIAGVAAVLANSAPGRALVHVGPHLLDKFVNRNLPHYRKRARVSLHALYDRFVKRSCALFFSLLDQFQALKALFFRLAAEHPLYEEGSFFVEELESPPSKLTVCEPFERLQVELYENECWSDTRGWFPASHLTGRPHWSDYTGDQRSCSPERFSLSLIPLPSVSASLFDGGEWTWEDSEWRIRHSFLVEECGKVGGESSKVTEGWVYYDSEWKTSTLVPSRLSSRRRRCWIRRSIRFTGDYHEARQNSNSCRYRSRSTGKGLEADLNLREE